MLNFVGVPYFFGIPHVGNSHGPLKSFQSGWTCYDFTKWGHNWHIRRVHGTMVYFWEFSPKKYVQKSTEAFSFKVIALAVEQNDGSTATEAVPFCKISDTKQHKMLEIVPPSPKLSLTTRRPWKMMGKEDDPASYWVSVTFQGRTVKLRGGTPLTNNGFCT